MGSTSVTTGMPSSIGVVHKGVDRGELLGRDALEVREVKAQAVGLDKGAGLMNVVAQNVLEGRVKQMGGSVRAAHALAALDVDARGHGVAELEAAGDDLAGSAYTCRPCSSARRQLQILRRRR